MAKEFRDLTIRALTPDLLDPYLAFFDSITLAVSKLIRTGVHQGLLAFVDDKPVGWCHAGPRHLIRNSGRMLGSLYYEANNIGSICCFVVAEPYRRQGVATRLLHAACDRFARMGLAYAEAYPSKGGPSERHYHGPLTIYLDAGFGTPSFRRPGPFYLLAIP